MRRRQGTERRPGRFAFRPWFLACLTCSFLVFFLYTLFSVTPELDNKVELIQKANPSEITILDVSSEVETTTNTVNLLRKTEPDTVNLQQEAEVERRSGPIEDVNKQPGSLSGGNLKPELKQEDLDEGEKFDNLELAKPGEHPKVALMFLAAGAIPTEPIWRTFLEGAAKLQLKVQSTKPQRIDPEVVAGRPLHSTISSLDEARYPGYKIQHGLVPPTKYRQTQYPHVKKRRALLEQMPDALHGIEDVPGQRDLNNSSTVDLDNKICPEESDLLAVEANTLLNSDYDGPAVYRNQDLFSVYVHSQPGFEFPSNSIFYGLQVPDPINCTNAFALHVLVLAELKLFESALQDPRNQKFILLSESCIPVHPPEVVYAQALYEEKSRVHACASRNPGRLELWRWKQKMETSQLQRQHWRKSQQWFILNRGHAELVVADQHVKEVFKRYCWSYGKHICVSDEHYIPTLLASYNLDEQTDCLGRGTWTDWSNQGWHPKTYGPENVTTTLLQRIINSNWPPCDPILARRSALELFEFRNTHSGSEAISKDCIESTFSGNERSFTTNMNGTSNDDWVSRAGYLPLGYECPLFARKFSPLAMKEMMETSLSCVGGGQGYWCRESLLASFPYESSTKTV